MLAIYGLTFSTFRKGGAKLLHIFRFACKGPKAHSTCSGSQTFSSASSTALIASLIKGPRGAKYYFLILSLYCFVLLIYN